MKLAKLSDCLVENPEKGNLFCEPLLLLEKKSGNDLRSDLEEGRKQEHDQSR